MIRKAIEYMFTGIGIGAVISTACMWLAGSIGSIWAFRVDYGLEKASLLGASADSWKPLLGGNAHYFKAIVSG